MRLIIIRHGETDYNVKGLIQGQRDCNLTSNGKKQADVLAERMKDDEFDLFFSSPLSRAMDTANKINKFHKKTIQTSNLLKERKFGELEGRHGIELDKESPGCLIDPFFQPKGGENMHDVFIRVKKYLDTKILKHKNTNKIIVVVGHKVINLSLVGILMDWGIEKTYKQKLDSTSICEVEIKDGKTKVLRFNDSKHLEKAGLSKVKEIKGIC
jgi:broad specificity phosphatase PhoE